MAIRRIGCSRRHAPAVIQLMTWFAFLPNKLPDTRQSSRNPVPESRFFWVDSWKNCCSMILSACENKIVMRMDSADVLQKIKNVMDVPPEVAAQLPDCLKFRIGRGLLFGAWAPDGPVKFLSAARRTVEGGRSLNAGWWAQPPE